MPVPYKLLCGKKINKGASGQDGDIGECGFFASSHNHIKIATEVHNKHSELPKIWLNENPTTRELKKLH